MATSTTKTLSPAELAKLEHAFATDPASEAYKPLAEAYLGMGRFMEAMVVCKKGVKAHPQVPDARILLARVYAEQGKDKKAIEELLGALQVSPTDKSALRMVGVLQLKNGESEAGKSHLLKAFSSDPEDGETKAAMEQYRIEAPKAAAPPPPPPPDEPAPVAVAPSTVPIAGPGAVPMAGPGARAQAQANGRPPARTQSTQNGPFVRGEEDAQASRPRPAGSRSAPPPPPGRRTQERAMPRPPVDVDDEEESSLSSSVSNVPIRRKKKGAGTTIALVVLLVVGLAGYAGYSSFTSSRNKFVKKKLNEASEALRKDSFAGYQAVVADAREVLERDSGNVAAHGYLAYAHAILWGEHGGGDDARRLAEEHLAEAKAGGDLSSQMFAAEALIQTYGGKGSKALTELQARVTKLAAEQKESALLYLTLGLIQMNAGDLEHSRDSLEKAQTMATSDARTYAALGNLYRRRDEGEKASRNFDFALRYEKNHPESLLGASLLILEQEDPDYTPAARMLKQLLEMTPPPSPRQLAMAEMARTVLVSRLSRDLPLYTNEQYRKQLSEVSGVTEDKKKAAADIARGESNAFSLDKQNPELRLLKGRRLLYEGQFDQAAAEIREAIKMDSSRSQFYVELGRALMEKPGGEKEAIDALSTALKTIGDSPKVMVMLGQAYKKAGRLDEALAQFDKATSSKDAKNPEARMASGDIYFQRENWNKAQDAYEKAATDYFGQSTKLAQVNTQLGRVFEKKGDRAKAEELFKRAQAADAEYAPFYFYYGSFLAADKKDPARAKELLTEYLKREPRGSLADEAKRISGEL